MISNEHSNFYDLLDLRPDASPQEIREAYIRTKAAYNKDSVALYSLIEPEEREEMLRRIEEAYHTLSNPQRRKEYDQHHGLIKIEEDPMDFIRLPSHKKIISIDRVPPMESTEDELLVSPPTDFTHPEPKQQPIPPQFKAPQRTQPSLAHVPNAQSLAQEIAAEMEWKGSFLKKIREANKISIEELSGLTKITKAYIQALEEDAHSKLPAAVYVRGFVTQVSKALKLPHEKVVSAYMARYLSSRPDQMPR